MQRLLILIFFVVVGAFVYYAARKPVTPVVQQTTVTPEKPKVKSAPPVATIANPYWKRLLEDYTQFVNEAVKDGQAPGVAVAIVQDTSVLLLKGFGVSDASIQDSVDVFSIFRLGSVSKSFASVLTGVLVQDNVLGWDDHVVQYLPDFELKSKESTEQITLRHLLSHTSGLPYHAFTDQIDHGANLEPLIYHLRDLNLTGPPGQTYSYQNVAYSVIGKVIESATSKPYGVVMKEKIFEPLNMQQASMSFDEIVASPDRTRPHVRTLRGWRPLSISTTYYNVGPAGGVNASISDMARWMLALTSSKPTVLKRGTKEELFKPFVKATARNRYFRQWKRSSGSYYSLGWRVLTFKEDTLRYHGGYVNGYRSEVAIKDNERIGICVLVNAAGEFADKAVPEFFKRYEKYRRDIHEWETLDPRRSVVLVP